jgi:spermidine/putrescine transport system permease protein
VIASLPRPLWLRASTVLYAVAFFAFLFLPLAVVAVFAFNDAPYPAPPWRGFTLDWFLGAADTTRRGLFADTAMLGSIWTSVVVASLGHAAVGAGGHGQCVFARAHAVSWQTGAVAC